MLEAIGFELEEIGGESSAVLVRGDASRGPTESIRWPDDDFVGAKGDYLSTNFLVRGSARPGDGLVFSVWYHERGISNEIEFNVSGSSFANWYPEPERDIVLRVLTFLEMLAPDIPVKSARCFDWEAGENWFLFEGDHWEARPKLVLETGTENSTRIFSEFSNRNPHLFRIDDQTDAVFFETPEGTQLALLRHNLVDGTLLPESSIDDGFFPVEEAREVEILKSCWRSKRGVDDIIAEYGKPDHYLGPILMPEEKFPRGRLENVKQQICYENLDDRYVVFFREYETGRTTTTLAGKKVPTNG
jgi:hypothetical protein